MSNWKDGDTIRTTDGVEFTRGDAGWSRGADHFVDNWVKEGYAVQVEKTAPPLKVRELVCELERIDRIGGTAVVDSTEEEIDDFRNHPLTNLRSDDRKVVIEWLRSRADA